VFVGDNVSEVVMDSHNFKISNKRKATTKVMKKQYDCHSESNAQAICVGAPYGFDCLLPSVNYDYRLLFFGLS
jgi:hypothetical protein